MVPETGVYAIPSKSVRPRAHMVIVASVCVLAGVTLLSFVWPRILVPSIVGDSGRPGLVRAAVSVLEGRGGEVAEGLGPSMKGRLMGIKTYFEFRMSSSKPRGKVIA